MRTPVTLKIKFKSANIDQFIERYSVDVSRGGIFIRTKEPLPVGTQLGGGVPGLRDGLTVIPKVAPTPPGFPRRTGVASKRPLG